MSVIEIHDYVDIATSYANARQVSLDSKQYLFDAVYEIVLLDAIRPSVDLLSVFWDTYNLNTQSVNSPTLLLSAVRALNNHVLVAGGYASLDEYFAAHPGHTVPALWQSLSAEAGYTISDDYVA
jgi:hypothetical protein